MMSRALAPPTSPVPLLQCDDCGYDLTSLAKPNDLPTCPQCGGHFVPRCLDCKYDLAGLPLDGKCPECGVRYTRANLIRVHLARKAASKDLRRKFATMPFMPIGLASPLIAVFVSGSAVVDAMGVILALAAWGAGLAGWVQTTGEKRIVHAEQMLVFCVPLAVLALLIVASPGGLYWCALIGVLFALVAREALRWSPLGSAICLIAGLLPIAGFGTLMLVDALVLRAKGFYWSNYDYPSTHGWRAMSRAQSLPASGAVIGFALMVAAIVLAYARRALVRLRTQRGFRRDARTLDQIISGELPRSQSTSPSPRAPRAPHR